MMNSKVKMSDVAKKILLLGDLEYYEPLRSLLKEQALWDSLYPLLFEECELRLHYTNYMAILGKENEYALLLKQVEMHMEQIYHFGESLAGDYPDEICSIYINQLKKEAEAAYGRKSYSDVCSHILLFASAGYAKESQEIMKEFKSKYKRKPAFVDELNKILWSSK